MTNAPDSNRSVEPLFTVESLVERGLPIRDVRFEEFIRDFEAADETDGVPTNPVLFYGDSDIAYWNRQGVFQETFGDLPGLNRGFGGARTWESLLYFHRAVQPYRPRMIVYNCGDNDIATLGSDGIESALLGTELFIEGVRTHMPETGTILVLAIHPAPTNEQFWRYQEEANGMIRDLCRESPDVEFVDYLHLLRNEAGRPGDAHFLVDGLHFTHVFYQTLGTYLRPMVEERLNR